MWNLAKIPKSVLLGLTLLYGFVTVLILIYANDISARSIFMMINVDENGDMSLIRQETPRRRAFSLLSSEEIGTVVHYDDDLANAIQYDIANDTTEHSSREGIRSAGKSLPQNSRFIFTSQMCAGLGNQLYRFASLYAIGKALNRTPFYVSDERCIRDFESEIRDICPNFYRNLYFFDRPDSSMTRTAALKNCCRFESSLVSSLASDSRRAVEITGATGLQSYRYFHSIRREIRDLFRCAPHFVAEKRDYLNVLLGGDASARRLCVHTRVGDFVPLKIASDLNATARLIDRAVALERKRAPDDELAVILLGEDKQFLQRLRDVKEVEQSRRLISARSDPTSDSLHYYIPRSMPRVEDLCFASSVCDSLLIATHVSTFSFWIGYLMPDESNVYYSSDFGSSSPYSSDNFPPEWTPLRSDDMDTRPWDKFASLFWNNNK